MTADTDPSPAAVLADLAAAVEVLAAAVADLAAAIRGPTDHDNPKIY